MQLVLRDSQRRVETTFHDPDGAGAAPTDPKLTVTRDSDGSLLVDDQDADDEDEGRVSFVLPEVDTVDLLVCDWSANEGSRSERVGVVGLHLCETGEVAAAVVAAGGKHPDTRAVRQARDNAELFLEDRCNVALRPSYARDEFSLDGRAPLLRPHARTIFAATLDGEDLDPADLEVDAQGFLCRTGSSWPQSGRLRVAYEHGFLIPPADANRAAIKLARHVLRPDVSNRDERATRIETEQASYGFLVTAGQGGAPTSIPTVNEFIEEHRYRAVG